MISLLLCIICTTLLGVIFKFLQEYPGDTYRIIVINYLTCSIIGLFYLQDTVFHPPYSPWIYYALFIGLLFILGFNIYAASIKVSGLGLTTVFQKMSVVLTVLFAIFLGESINTLQAIGMLIALISIVLMLGLFKNKKLNITKIHTLSKFLILSFFIAFLIEFAFMHYNKLMIKLSSKDIQLPSYIFMVAAVTGLVYEFIRSKQLYISKRELISGIILGIPNFYSIFFLSKSLASGTAASVVFPVLNCSVILLSVCIATFFYKERISKLKIIGICLAMMAIYLITSNR